MILAAKSDVYRDSDFWIFIFSYAPLKSPLIFRCAALCALLNVCQRGFGGGNQIGINRQPRLS